MTNQDYLHTETGGAPIRSWTRGVPVDERTWRKLRNVAALPFVHRHVVAMPDAHLGATVGSVIPTKGAVVPAAVGIDIGCGMMAVRTALRTGNLPDNLAGVRTGIERRAPTTAAKTTGALGASRPRR